MDISAYLVEYHDVDDSTSTVSLKTPDVPMKTLSDLLAAIPTWTYLAPVKRSRLAGMVSSCVTIVARNTAMEYAPASAFSCDVAWLNSVLFLRPPKAHGLRKVTMQNYIGALREALRQARVLHDDAKFLPPSEGPWQIVLSGLNCTYARMGLAVFAGWCDSMGILPEAVSDDTFIAYKQVLLTQQLHSSIDRTTGNLVKAWRRLIKQGAVKASGTLSGLKRRQAYTLPIAAFPASFQDDYARFAERLKPANVSGPFRGDKPPKTLSDATVKLRLFSVRQAVASLVLGGRDVSTITSLADLVEEGAFEKILMYFWEHAIALKVGRGVLVAGDNHPSEAGVTVQTGAISVALMMVARYHVKLDALALDRLMELARDVRPNRQTEINEKTRKILNTLSVPAVRLRLLHLPSTLMKRAEDLLAERPLEAARVAMIATAIKIELMLPLRIGNLTRLRLDTHLQRFDPRTDLISLLSIPRTEVKNAMAIESPVDAATAAFIERFVREFRPLLQPGDSRYLFPSGHGDRLEARSMDAMRKGITDAVADHVGVTMHVHAFRAFAGMLLLEDAPGALEDLRLLLGHKTLKMAECYYAYVKPAHAAHRMADIMDRARKGITPSGASRSPTTSHPRPFQPRPGR